MENHSLRQSSPLLMEEKTDKQESWPTHLFDCCSGGISLCLWGFLCPVCLFHQGWSYTRDLSYTSSEELIPESQFERYPPWSCGGLDCPHFFILFFVSCCCCLFGFFVGCGRHQRYSGRENLPHYCSSQPRCCRWCEEISIEDCLIGHFCSCCSLIQVAMSNDERFRMQSKVEGNVNIKRAR